MFWTAVLVIVALTFCQVPAGLVKPEVINEDATAAGVTSVSSRIVSGWEAYPGQFPHVAALRSINPGGDMRNCAGSVVHRNWVLTAAVCTAGRIAVLVRAGVTDLATTPEYISETTEWWVYPTFNVNRPNDVQPNDFSALKLQQPLVYSTLVQPIRIQPSIEAYRDYSNEVFIASGWGRLWTDGDYPDVLNWVYLRAISNLDCRRVYGTSTITDNHICARGHSITSQSTCTGDNGGSLVYISRDGEPVLVGLATFWNAASCHTGNPAGFTRTGPFHGWLTEVTGLDFENLTEEDEVTVTPTPLTTEELRTTTTDGPEPTTATTEVPEPTTTSTKVPEPTTTSSEVPEPTTTTTEVTTPPSTESPESEPTTLTTEAPATTVPTTFLPWSSTPEPMNSWPPGTSNTEPTMTTTEVPETTTMPTVLPWTSTTEPTMTDIETAMTNPKPTSSGTSTEPTTTTTEVPEPNSEESDENSNDSDDSESNEDPYISQLINKLQVKVKVKVKVNKNYKKNAKAKKVKNI